MTSAIIHLTNSKRLETKTNKKQRHRYKL